MHLRTPNLLRGRRPARPVPRRGAHAAPAAVPARERRDDPADAAFYTCHCGFAWTGPVTTSVACPHCGSGQAW